MAIPPWAVEALRRGVGGVLDKVPPEKIEQLKKRAGDLLADLPQTAARGVDSMMRGLKVGKDSMQRWTRRHVALVTPVVNASGCLCNPAIVGVPLCNDALDIAMEALQAGSLNNDAAQDRLSRRLANCLGNSDLGILIASTVDGACLAVANANHDKPLYFHRSQSQRLPSGTPIPDAFAAGMALRSDGKIHEVGSVDRVDPSDSRQVNAPAILVAVENGVADCNWYHSDADAASINRELTRIVYMPVAQWNGRQADQSGLPLEFPKVLKRLQSAAEIVITPGDGAMGGPRCGLIIGDKKRLEVIAKCSVWPAVAADVSIQAAMTVTLELFESGHADEVPVQAMMRTSEENLRSRAERLATRLAAEPTVRSCQITDQPATFSAAGKWSLPSRQLKLAHRDLLAAEWAARLSSEVPAVLAGVEAEAIVVDLRWIQPSDDSALVATLAGHHLEHVVAQTE